MEEITSRNTTQLWIMRREYDMSKNNNLRRLQRCITATKQKKLIANDALHVVCCYTQAGEQKLYRTETVSNPVFQKKISNTPRVFFSPQFFSHSFPMPVHSNTLHTVHHSQLTSAAVVH